jgi:uncharacterized membrane protein YfhO
LAINLSIALHCFLASLFAFWFAKYMGIGSEGSLLAALTFAYGAPYFMHVYAGHLSNLSTMVWLPLVLMGVEAFLRNRQMRYALASGVALGMQILAGHPQYLFYSMIAVVFYFALRLWVGSEPRNLSRCAVGFCLTLVSALALAAVQILPALELTVHSARQALSYQWVSIFSLPPENLITLVLPDFFGDMLKVPYWGKNYLWEMSLYIGIVPLIMAIVAVFFEKTGRILIFGLMAAVSLILALGKHTPLLAFLYAVVPGFNLFRGLSKFVFVFSLATAMLAGYGLTRVISLAEEKSPKLKWISYGLLAVAVLSLVVGWLALMQQDLWSSFVQTYNKGEDNFSAPLPFTREFFSASAAALSENALSAAVIVILLAGLLLAALMIKRLPKSSLSIGVLILAAADLWVFSSRYLVTFDPAIVRLDDRLKTFLKHDQEPFRLATSILPLANTGMIEGIENVGGYDAIILKEYSEFINFSQNLPTANPNSAIAIEILSPLLDLLNVKYYIVELNRNIALRNLSLVLESPDYKVYRNSGALPRSFIVHDVRVMDNRRAILDQMARPEFTPRSYAYVEQPIDPAPHRSNIQSPLPKIVGYSANRVTIEAELQESGLLVLGDVYYPGWKAFVDGTESRIYRTNYVVRGVFLSGGRHSIEFRYEPLSFKVGAMVTLITLVLVTAYLVRVRFWSCFYPSGRG